MSGEGGPMGNKEDKETKVKETPPTKEEAAIAKGVEKWVSEFCRNSPISEHTPAWNHLMEVLPELPKCIGKENKS